MAKLRNVIGAFLQIKRRYARLAEIGRFQEPITSGKYEPGQLFLHRIFGYRGVILFTWTARLYDRDKETRENEKSLEENGSFNPGKEMKAETQTYYQALIDNRDSPFIRAQPEIVTFLGYESENALYSIPGLDYISQGDVLPYMISDISSHPIHHELFDKFLYPEAKRVPPFAPRDALHSWQEKNRRWLELTDVHRETTSNIRITVMPFYMGTKVQKKLVIEPVLTPQEPAFQYTSHVSLQAPSGNMWGKFRFERSDGSTFETPIPPFALESREEENPDTSGTT
ncbi:polymerase delta-interacting protein 2 [Acropora cervicornis]|uniref:Polymerase delta-interacting protein 2 n=1 Tax=Acropora cervicornis TaxID=6130 RepID=A0AAD9VHR9_ACRCE|nr:polymerase delta-interacting protein 2 [Acropora cervicornis]